MKRRALSPLEHALGYAQEGWAVFPARPGGKTPLTTNGHKDATRDPRKIKRWWAQWPNANIGIATGAPSGIIVLDVDVKNGIDGEASLRALVGDYEPLPATLEARTPSGGRHLFFLAQPGKRIACSAGKLGPGLDIRGDGGYVLVAPSVVGGRAYEWI